MSLESTEGNKHAHIQKRTRTAPKILIAHKILKMKKKKTYSGGLGLWLMLTMGGSLRLIRTHL